MNPNKVFAGFNLKSFNAIFSLLMNYLRKQKALLIITLLFFLTLFIIEAFLFSGNLQDIHFPDSSKTKFVNSIILTWNFIPILLFSLIAIPSTINSIQKSTMIKRIGATRLNERSYISIIWIIYFVMMFILFSVTNIAELIIYAIFANNYWVYTQGWTSMYFYSLLFILFSTSFGVFLGVIPISGGRIAIVTFTFLIMIFFSGIFGGMTMFISERIPMISLLILIINPIIFITYFSSMFMYQNVTPIFIAVSIIYPIVLSAIFFSASISLISFNKIK